MYSDRWSPGLRQGDVLGKVFFPALGAQFQTVSTTASVVGGLSMPAIENVLVKGEQRFAIVISHDCEFNEDKRNRLLLARLESVPGNLKEDQLIALRASNDVESRSQAKEKVAGV